MKYLTNFFKHKVNMKSKYFNSSPLKNMYDVVIHVGSPKSGTSALQNFFLNNQYLLSQHDIFYPKHGLDPNGISGGHSQLAILLNHNQLDEAHTLFQSWFAQAQRKNKLLLLSSEAYFNLGKKMDPFLKDKKVLIIAYHRDLVEYYISVHNQLIKRHFGTINFKQYAESILLNNNNAGNLVNKSFLSTYEEWASLVGNENLIVRPYDKENFFEGKIEKDFISLLGLGSNGFLLKEKKINISYTEDALELKRMINYVLNKESSLNHVIDVKLQKYSEEQANDIVKNTTSSMDQAVYIALRDFFYEEEQKIRELYLKNINTHKGYNFSLKNNDKSSEATISLDNAIEYLLNDKKIKTYLKQCTLKKLKFGYSAYPIYKLAELLKIPNLEQYTPVDHWFNQYQLEKMISGKYREEDFLRDTSILLERRGDIDNAYKFIFLAKKRRPKGKRINELFENFRDQIKTEKKTV